MQPSVWLAHRGLIKLRTKLPDWRREDILALAAQEFGGHDLNKNQLSALYEVLKTPRLQKPTEAYYRTQALPQPLLREVRWQDNGTQPFEGDTRWVYAGKHVRLRFGNPRDLVSWALALLEDDVHVSWPVRFSEWGQRTQLATFDPPKWLPRYKATKEATRALKRRRGQDRRMLLPLPDSEQIRKRYFSLEVGDVLKHPTDGTQLVVESVRINLDTPPTLTLRKEVARGSL